MIPASVSICLLALLIVHLFSSTMLFCSQNRKTVLIPISCCKINVVHKLLVTVHMIPEAVLVWQPVIILNLFFSSMLFSSENTKTAVMLITSCIHVIELFFAG